MGWATRNSFLIHVETRNFSPKHSDQTSQSMKLTNGMARFLGTWGEQSQWPPLTEIMNLKKLNLFIYFILFEKINIFWVQITHFCISNINFATPWTLLPGAATPLVPTPLPSTPLNFTTHPNVALRLRMIWAISLLPIYAFMVWTGTMLSFTLTRWTNEWCLGTFEKSSAFSEIGEQISITFISLKMEGLGMVMFLLEVARILWFQTPSILNDTWGCPRHKTIYKATMTVMSRGW